MHLSPDEHVLSSKRNLLVPLADVRSNSVHDLVFRKIDLRIKIWHTKLASSPAAGRHLYYPEGSSRIREQDRLAFDRVFDCQFLWKIFTIYRLGKEVECILGFAA